MHSVRRVRVLPEDRKGQGYVMRYACTIVVDGLVSRGVAGLGTSDVSPAAALCDAVKEVRFRLRARRAAKGRCQVKYATHGVLAGAYLRGDKRGAFLTHVVARVDGENWAGARVLCGRVAIESINDDERAPSYSERAPATCQVCARRDPRAAKAGAK